MEHAIRRKKRVRWLVALGLVGITLAYALAVSARVESGLQAANTGFVLDAETQKPLAGALVVVRWQRQVTDPLFVGHGGRMLEGTGCLYRTVVRTDDQGRFSVPSTRDSFHVEGNLRINKSEKYLWDMYTYVPGYGVTNFLSSSPNARVMNEHPFVVSRDMSGAEVLEPVLLAKSDEPPSTRAESLGLTMWRFTCKPFAVEPDEFLREIYEDAYATTCTADGFEGALALAKLRRATSPPMAYVPQTAQDQIAAIQSRYPPPPPYPTKVSVKDGATICALLK